MSASIDEQLTQLETCAKLDKQLKTNERFSLLKWIQHKISILAKSPVTGNAQEQLNVLQRLVLIRKELGVCSSQLPELDALIQKLLEALPKDQLPCSGGASSKQSISQLSGLEAATADVNLNELPVSTFQVPSPPSSLHEELQYHDTTICGWLPEPKPAHGRTVEPLMLVSSVLTHNYHLPLQIFPTPVSYCVKRAMLTTKCFTDAHARINAHDWKHKDSSFHNPGHIQRVSLPSRSPQGALHQYRQSRRQSSRYTTLLYRKWWPPRLRLRN